MPEYAKETWELYLWTLHIKFKEQKRQVSRGLCHLTYHGPILKMLKPVNNLTY